MNELMRSLVVNFPKQLDEAVAIASKAQLEAQSGLKNVLISGLGGSGIGATIVSNWVIDSCRVPIAVNKGYFLPSFVKKGTLAICCSYSGNTEETFNVLELAHKSGAKIVCISSGGKMIDYCKKHKLDHIVVPGGMPPRSCLGYSLVQLVKVLTFYKLAPVKLYRQLEAGAAFLAKEQENIDALSLKLAEKISTKIPIIYSEDKMEGVAVRYRQQINENSKMLCWHHVIPEMNHNEMVGWRDKNDQIAVLFINNKSDFSRNVQRKKLNEETIKNYTKNIYNINSKGRNIIEQSLYHIHFTDLLSIHLSNIRQIDSNEIDVINKLKASLEAQPW